MAAVAVAENETAEKDQCQQSQACSQSKATDQCLYQEVTFETACSQYPHFKHAAHCVIYSFDDQILWTHYKTVANIMMQVRFDGTFGFAGGYVDAVDDTIVTGLNRELVEEINLDLNTHRVTQDSHICSHVCSEKSLVTHFYGLEVSLEQYREIERRVLTAHEWGRETLGIFRVPLYTWKDNIRGFPMFLCGKFIGNAKEQLQIAIERRHVMPLEDLRLAVSRSNGILAASAQCRN